VVHPVEVLVLGRRDLVESAERELTNALRTLQEKGESSRCTHPAAKLAEIRVLQGRFEEAERLLSAYPDHPAIVRTQIDLAMARDEYRLAESLLRKALDRLPAKGLLAVPYLARLVRVSLALNDAPSASAARDSLQATAQATGDARATVESQLADAALPSPRDAPMQRSCWRRQSRDWRSSSYHWRLHGRGKVDDDLGGAAT
jgi:predicted Zn-dependent protease